MLQGSQENLSLVSPDGTIFFSLGPIGTGSLAPAEGGPVSLSDRVHPDDLEIVRRVMAELLADPESSVAFQARFRDEEGEWRWFDSIATNFLEEPLIGAVVVNSLDVTEWKRLQQQVEQMSLHR